MDFLINGANVLYVAAYFTTNLLRLRLLTMVAAACLCLYFLLQPVPLYNVVAWNLFFLALNSVQVTRLLLSRRSATQKPRRSKRAAFMHSVFGRGLNFQHLAGAHGARSAP